MTRSEILSFFLPHVRKVAGNEKIRIADIKDLSIGQSCSLFAGETLLCIQAGDLTAYVAIPDKKVLKLSSLTKRHTGHRKGVK